MQRTNNSCAAVECHRENQTYTQLHLHLNNSFYLPRRSAGRFLGREWRSSRSIRSRRLQVVSYRVRKHLYHRVRGMTRYISENTTIQNDNRDGINRMELGTTLVGLDHGEVEEGSLLVRGEQDDRMHARVELIVDLQSQSDSQWDDIQTPLISTDTNREGEGEKE